MSQRREPHDEAHDALPSAAPVATLLAHQREFLGFLERRLGDRALAQDVLQDAFLRLDKLAALRNDESAVAWFYRVLRNATIDHARRSQVKTRALTAFSAELAHASESESASEVHAQVCRCVGVLKETLKAEYKSALDEVELSGVSVTDYAREAGISANNAAVRLYRARNALRKQVRRTCGSCAARGCTTCTCGE